MARLLLIETSTALCSTAISQDGRILSYREDSTRQHSSLTVPFIKEMLEETSLEVGDLDAVALSMGPGSYTGLRVGSSTAKGLCFGAGIPLVAASSLEVLVGEAILSGLVPEGCTRIVPMIDARRMEVYSAVFSPDGRQLTETAPVIVEEGTFKDILSEGPVLFIGDGALKCAPVLDYPSAHIAQVYPSAKGLSIPAEREFAKGNFRDVAYFEPFYLKDFVATVSKKRLF